MKRILIALLFLSELSINAQSILQIRPDVITECSSNGLGHATIVWNYLGRGPVQVRVGPDSEPMTGFPGPIGSADTGDWVTDGLLFTLGRFGRPGTSARYGSSEVQPVSRSHRGGPFGQFLFSAAGWE